MAEALDRELDVYAQRLVGDLPPARSLLPKALIDEAYVRLTRRGRKRWKDTAHFLAAAARTMQCVLVDHIREAKREKRGGGECFFPLEESLVEAERRVIDPLVFQEALRDFASREPLVGRAVELHFFHGLTFDETAKALGISRKTLGRKWASAIGVLRTALIDV